MRVINNLKDVQIVLNEINNQLDLIRTKPSDNHGLRITNVGQAVDDSDVPTLAQVKKLIKDSQA